MSRIYYVTQPGGTPHGPYDLKTLQIMLDKGLLNSQTLYFQAGLSSWHPITKLIPLTNSQGMVYGMPPITPANSRLAYIVIAIFLGTLGIHNFYAGYTSKGVIQLLMTIISCGVLTFIVFIWNVIEICTVKEDANGIPFS